MQKEEEEHTNIEDVDLGKSEKTTIQDQKSVSNPILSHDKKDTTIESDVLFVPQTIPTHVNVGESLKTALTATPYSSTHVTIILIFISLSCVFPFNPYSFL